jgi:hypothetical protein
MLRAILCSTALSVLLSCTGALASGADPCGPPAPQGDPRTELRSLGCLTAVAAVDPDRRVRWRERIERAFRVLYEDLLKRPFSDEEVSFWVELYRLAARFYPRRMTLRGEAPIPLTVVNAHHHSVPFWIERSKETSLGTLLHFDTHSDTDSIPRPGDVQRAVEHIRVGSELERSWHVLAHAVHRNSMPVSGAVLAAGVEDVVWAKPSWVHEPAELGPLRFFYGRPKGSADDRPFDVLRREGALLAAFRGQGKDRFSLYYDPADNGDLWLPRRERELATWAVAHEHDRPHALHYDHLHPIRFSISGADSGGGLAQKLSGEQFVLDIDLDYFVNVGHDSERTDSPPSHGQRLLRTTPDVPSSAAVFAADELQATLLSGERELIEGRIARFRDTLWELRRAGKKPTIVSIADSAHLPFGGARQAEEGPGFVPPVHAYWVNERVLSVIREVFEHSGDPPPAPASPQRARIVPAGSREAEDGLWRAFFWVLAAARQNREAEHVGAYLLLLHALALYAPEAALREAADAAARIQAATLLTPSALQASVTKGREALAETLRRAALGQLYGAGEAELAAKGAAWLARGHRREVTVDVGEESRPLSPVAAVRGLGYAALVGEEEARALSFLRSLQASDGGFGASSLPEIERALLALLAVRGLLPAAPPAERTLPDRRPLWPDIPVTRGERDDALLRGTLFAVARLGEKLTPEESIEALLLLGTVLRFEAPEAARRVAAQAAKRFGSRLPQRLEEILRGTRSVGALARFADAARAFATVGVPAPAISAELATALLASAPREQPADRASLAAEAHRAATWGYFIARLGGPATAFSEGYERALRVTPFARQAYARDPKSFAAEFSAVHAVLLAGSGGLRAPLRRRYFPEEWAFLEASFGEVHEGGRAELVACLLEARRAAGADGSSARERSLAWQLLHDQSPDGSWGREKPEDDRLAVTWSALAALGDVKRDPSDPVVRRAQAILAARK